MGLSCSRPLRALGLVFALSSCQGLTDVEIDYVHCIPIDEAPYVDAFDGDYQGLLDRCWQSANTESGEVRVDDRDLLIEPKVPVTWSEGAPPLFYQVANGDFLIVTRVEAATGLSVCLDPQDGAGLVVRNSETNSWATLLVHPQYAQDPPELDDCTDAATPPGKATLGSFGFPGSVELEKTDVGEDAEGDVAICRTSNYLSYFYLDLAQDAWVPMTNPQEVDLGPLEVGLTTTSGRGTATDIEGHFASVAYWPRLAGDSCTRPLETFRLPVDP
jgi:hypothetical protein